MTGNSRQRQFAVKFPANVGIRQVSTPEPSVTSVGFAASDLRIARPAGARAGRHWKRLTFSSIARQHCGMIRLASYRMAGVRPEVGADVDSNDPWKEVRRQAMRPHHVNNLP